jgi:hypothetical protein
VKFRVIPTSRSDLTTIMAPPKAVGAATMVPRKSHTRAVTTEPNIEETHGTSSSDIRFPHNYISPMKYDTPPITLYKNIDYMMVTLDIPE